MLLGSRLFLLVVHCGRKLAGRVVAVGLYFSSSFRMHVLFWVLITFFVFVAFSHACYGQSWCCFFGFADPLGCYGRVSFWFVFASIPLTVSFVSCISIVIGFGPLSIAIESNSLYYSLGGRLYSLHISWCSVTHTVSGLVLFILYAKLFGCRLWLMFWVRSSLFVSHNFFGALLGSFDWFYLLFRPCCCYPFCAGSFIFFMF